jgi:parallel beta-helix repeat protein
VDAASNGTPTDNVACNEPIGIYITAGSNYSLTRENASYDTGFGIQIVGGENDTLTGNTVNNNTQYGIHFLNTKNSTLDGNTASGNSGNGIRINTCTNVGLTGNTAISNNIGFFLLDCTNVNLTENTASGNAGTGIDYEGTAGACKLHDNMAAGNGQTGILINAGHDNALIENNASYNTCDGIEVYDNVNDMLIGNIANNNTRDGIYFETDTGCNLLGSRAGNNTRYGIFLADSTGNNVAANTMINNDNGIRLSSASGNRLWQNTIRENTHNAYVVGTAANDWNSSELLPYVYFGQSFVNYTDNYWGDYVGTDIHLDGIGDGAYTIAANNVDNNPMLIATPVAVNFTANRTSGTVPVTVQFNDTSKGYIGTWKWNFSDETPNATARNATHTFAVPGKYKVTLTVTDGGDNVTQKTGYITVLVQSPTANFTANVTAGSWPPCVQFNDTAFSDIFNGPTAWQWSFGDGRRTAPTGT